MRKISFFTLTILCLNLLVSGCASSPEARFYTLNAVTAQQKAADKHNVAVKIGPISMPDMLDQAQMVTRTGANTLELNEFNRWGGDLQDNFQRILGENISILLPTDHVQLTQEISLVPVDFQVIVNVREFYGMLGGTVTLNADWSIVRFGKEKLVTAKKSVLKETTSSMEYQEYAAVLSRLLAIFSREITDTISLQSNQ
jgi:uncharacterized protein